MAPPSVLTFPRKCLPPQSNLMTAAWLMQPKPACLHSRQGKRGRANSLPVFKNLYWKPHLVIPPASYLPGPWLPPSAREAEKWSFSAEHITTSNKIRILLKWRREKLILDGHYLVRDRFGIRITRPCWIGMEIWGKGSNHEWGHRGLGKAMEQ